MQPPNVGGISAEFMFDASRAMAIQWGGKPRSPGSASIFCLAAAVALAFLAVAAVEADEPGKDGADDDVYRLYPTFESLPGVDSQDIRHLWTTGIRAEGRGDFLSAARVYEQIARRLPEDSHAYWRTGRAYWQVGEYLPSNDKAERIRYFTLTKKWATDGLAVNPKCGECCLYRFAGISRLATARGLFTAIRYAKEMAELLDRGIALHPTHSDNEWNMELGNLYYAASHLYRLMPDWLWLRWILGVCGDRERALDYARKAHEITPIRIDYSVALGAALLCVGTEEGDQESITEGIAVLREAARLPRLRYRDDSLFLEHAQKLIAEPDEACTYSPDGWIDVEGTLAAEKGAQH